MDGDERPLNWVTGPNVRRLIGLVFVAALAWFVLDLSLQATRTSEARDLHADSFRLVEAWRQSHANSASAVDDAAVPGLPPLGTEDLAWSTPGVTLSLVGPESPIRRHDPGYMEVTLGVTEAEFAKGPGQAFTRRLRVLVRFSEPGDAPRSAWEERYMTDVEAGTWYELYRNQGFRGPRSLQPDEPPRRISVPLQDVALVRPDDENRRIRVGSALTATGRNHDLRVEWRDDEGGLVARSAVRRVIVEPLTGADEKASEAIAAVRSSCLPLALGLAYGWYTSDSPPPVSFHAELEQDSAQWLDVHGSTALAPQLRVTRARALACLDRGGEALSELDLVVEEGTHPLLLAQVQRLRAELLRR